MFAATFPGRAGRWQRPVAMVSFGDSVFTDIGGLTPIPDRLAERLGISFYNASMGGTCAARLEAERRLDSARGSTSESLASQAGEGRPGRGFFGTADRQAPGGQYRALSGDCGRAGGDRLCAGGARADREGSQ